MDLRLLFDYNVIAANPALNAMIEDTLKRYGEECRVELADDDLEMVSAAGSEAIRYHAEKKDV